MKSEMFEVKTVEVSSTTNPAGQFKELRVVGVLKKMDTISGARQALNELHIAVNALKRAFETSTGVQITGITIDRESNEVRIGASL